MYSDFLWYVYQLLILISIADLHPSSMINLRTAFILPFYNLITV
jgi:hypothetical protein